MGEIRASYHGSCDGDAAGCRRIGTVEEFDEIVIRISVGIRIVRVGAERHLGAIAQSVGVGVREVGIGVGRQHVDAWEHGKIEVFLPV